MVSATGTRQRILRTAMELFCSQGYQATGLTQVLAQSNAPKGSLYFHFPGGKEQLAVESVTAGAAELRAVIESVLADAASPQAAVNQIVVLFAASLENSGFTQGCPVATVALEASSGSELLRTACAQSYESWIDLLVAHFSQWAIPEQDRESLAAVALAGLEGALLLSRVHRDIAPLRHFAKHIGALLTID
jgi:TetR/AcrR family transcriptional repressor of lmrAB and yxaGH operons